MTAGTSLVAAMPKAAKLPENKFPKEVGPAFAKKVMPWFEQYWHDKGKYPSETDIITRFGWTVAQVELLNKSKFWLLALDRRGITRPSHSADHLTDRQIAAITILTNFSDLRPPVARLSAIGVSEEELNGWYANPHFKQELTKRADDILHNIYPEAQTELARMIKKGNFNALKFYYEITGRAQSPEAVNLKQAMQILVEAVQKHVKDPEVLEAIAAEVQSIRGLSSV